jgi:hypothetical protein
MKIKSWRKEVNQEKGQSKRKSATTNNKSADGGRR